eukprot:jgi/Mesen1/2572/ME000162S01698
MELQAHELMDISSVHVAVSLGATIVYPLDTIKTRMQAQHGAESEGEQHFKNELDCAVRIIKEEGVGSLYTGLVPQLVGVAPEKALKLTVNELLLSCLESAMPGARIWALELIAGGGGGFSQVVFTNPVEIGKKKSVVEVVRELGFGGLYSGSLITMARDIPSSALFFASYAFLQQAMPDASSFVTGCLAAIPASYVVTPIDVVKTRMQMETPPGEKPYAGPIECAQRILDTEGAGAFFKGGLARVLRYSPQFGITLLLYSIWCQ